MYEDEREEKQSSVVKIMSNLKGRLVSTNSQLEDCILRIQDKNVSPHKLLSHLKSTTSQLDSLRFSLEKHTNKLKRRRKEYEYISKKKSKKIGKIGIFIHVVGEPVAVEVEVPGYETASRLYKIEMDADKYVNPSPPLMSFRDRFNNSRPYDKVKCKTKPHPIEPVFRFTFQEGYPFGMACVPFGTKQHLYLMGGSITYKLYFTKSVTEAYKLYETVNTTDPNMYPPDVYVFDCFTCKLLPPQDSPPPMNSGKSADPFTFIENRKLYVLSSSTKVPKELHMFEVFDPNSRTWTVLGNPPYDWGKFYAPVGSVLINGVFFISFYQDGFPITSVHIYSYRVGDNEWDKKVSVYMPSNRSLLVVPTLERDSVFVQNKLYSANVRQLFRAPFPFHYPILSYGRIPSTAKLDAHEFDAVAIPNLTPLFPWDACWPIYDGGLEGNTSARLVHLGGLLEGTRTDSTCFGFVQVLEPRGGCHIRFVVFEAFGDEITRSSDTYKEWDYTLPDESGPFFRAKTLHAGHFYSTKFLRSRLGAVCALVLS